MNAEDRILKYLTGAMSPDESTKLEAQMANDSDLKEIYDEYVELLEAVDNEPIEEPSKNPKERFSQMLNKEIKELHKPRLNPRYLFIGIIFLLSTLMVSQWIFNYSPAEDMNEETIQFAEVEGRISYDHLASQKRPSQRISTLNTLENVMRLDADIIRALREVLYNEESINVQLAVIESLSRYTDQNEVKELLLNALKDIDAPVIRINIIKTLTGQGLNNAIPEFKKLLEKDDLDPSVRDELHAGLIKLI